jgi:pimeloyl-ACP methyl ester carboxylesterase
MPGEMGPLKSEAYERYLHCFRRAAEFLETPPEILRVTRAQHEATGYLRIAHRTSGSKRVPAVLVMCGGDMYKEDREKYAEGALAEGLAALVVDAPGTGQTTFPHAPESVVAWQAALDELSSRPEIDVSRLGAFGVSRGGLWVMRLAAIDGRIKALISVAPSGVGYWGTAEERAEWRKHVDDRAKYWFGPRATRPSQPKQLTEDEQRKDFMRWSLKDNGLLQNLTMPMLLINGKRDHLTPIGNLYMLLETGPPTGRTARVYENDGHIAAKNEPEWGPAAWKWLRQQLDE